VLDTAGVCAEAAHATHQCGHFRHGQPQLVRSVHQHLCLRQAVSVTIVVAEAIGRRLQNSKGLDVGLFPGGIPAAGQEGYLYVVTSVLRRLLDGRRAAEDDQVGEGDLPAIGCRVVEALLNTFQGLEDLGQLRRVIDRPVLLRGQANAGTIGTTAHVAAAEGGR